MSTPIRVVGIAFDHMHIGDQLKTAIDHPGAELVGVLDVTRERPEAVLADLGVDTFITTDFEELIRETRPDVAFVCSTTDAHPEWVTTLAGAGVHMIIEKPVADSLAAAERMVADAAAAGVVLSFNWPIAWVESHRTAKRLLDDGAIGELQTVHSYGGNRGPLYHGHGKIELTPTVEDKANSWWYQPEAGGGSLRDYLGYGATLGTWFRNGGMPWAVTAAHHIPAGLKVDEQSVVVCHYDEGLSVMETRWGTYSDPWTVQPSPHCGYVLNGTLGSIASWDYDKVITLHDKDGVRQLPVDESDPRDQTSIANMIAHLQEGRALDPPMTSEISLKGHRIVEAAVISAFSGRLVRLDEL